VRIGQRVNGDRSLSGSVAAASEVTCGSVISALNAPGMLPEEGLWRIYS